ncbi:MAG: EamA family transporter RarD [Akkermansiaceae bacterium]|nr:EamA family transporter RarD [Akkermansiaceae bacterium]
MDRQHSGLLAALGAFTLWGVLPIYWKLIDFLPPPSIVAQRSVWSLLILLLIVLARREGRELLGHLRNRRIVASLLLSGALLVSNWLLYVWATLNGRIIEGALGYYLNPFFNMLFGALWFGERHRPLQLVAIAIALGGVALQVPAVGHFPWIALLLAVTFSLYAVVKKRAPLESRTGLTVETLLLSPVALLWLGFHPTESLQALTGHPLHAALVIGTGIATTLPLLCFGHAARNIRLSTLGIMQFLGPTLQFLIGWKLYGEPMTTIRLLSFALIWLAIGLYASQSLLAKTNKPEPEKAGL